MEEVKQLLYKILDIIQYTDEKEEFTTQFIDACSGRTIINILKTLPKEKQDEIRRKMTTTKNSEDEAKILDGYIPSDQYLQEFRKVVPYTINEWMATIEPSLTSAQRNNVEEFVKNAFPPQNTSSPNSTAKR